MELTRPLLAADLDGFPLNKLSYPLLGSAKIDGIRGLVYGAKVVSRSMKPIRNKHTQLLFGLPRLEGLDGELVVGNPWDPNLMQQTSSGVMKIEGRPQVKYYIFDKWNEDNSFINRWTAAGAVAQRSGLSNVIHLTQTYIANEDDLLAFEQHTLQLGFEGVMLRSINGRYKQNRSTIREGILLKLKRFHDAEAIITDFEPLYRNDNTPTLDERGFTKRSSSQDGKVAMEQLGSFTVRDMVSGAIFSIGSGFSSAQRESFWQLRTSLRGKIVKYKSFKVGVKDAPRFPIFLGFRDPTDM